MSLAYNFNFEKRIDNASYGQLMLTVVNTPGVDEAYPILVQVEVTGPSGEVIKNYGDDDDPDFSITSGETETVALVPIETNSLNGADLEGNYTVNIKKKNNGAGTYTNTIVDEVIPYSPINGEDATLVASLEASVNCLTKLVTVSDVTSYEGYTISSYELKLTPPVIPGVSLSTVTTTARTLQAALQYTNVTYQGSVLAVVSFAITGEDGDEIVVVYNATVQAIIAIPVTCPANICDFITCVQTAMAALELQACNFGGINKLSLQQQSNYFKLMHNSMMLLAGQGCGNSTMVNTAITNLEALIECNCGCDENDAPKPIGGSQGSSVTAWTAVANASLANSWVNGSLAFRFRRMDNFLVVTGNLKRTAITGATSSSLFGTTNPIADTAGLVIETGFKIPITDQTTGLQVGYITRGSGSAWTVVTFANFSGANNNYIDCVVPLSL